MIIEQRKWTTESGWKLLNTVSFPHSPQLVLAFCGSSLARDSKYFQDLKNIYPKSHIVTCSTAGEILGEEVRDNSIAATAIYFEKTSLRFGQVDIANGSESYEAGKKAASQLRQEGLAHALIFSDGLKVNGTKLVEGITEVLPKNIAVTGGLVGDGKDFKHTYVGLDNPAQEGKIVLIGLYGNQLRIGYGSLGGFDPFGPERTITKAKDNILYELDGKPALSLYKEYLGDEAKDLPGSGLLFPLTIRIKQKDGTEVEPVRTLLAVNEQDQSMTFAGDMPEGVKAKLMKANFDRLIDGASKAANISLEELGKTKPELAILISCVGRKLILQERTEEEIEAVREVVGKDARITGFYSYGEICPTAAAEKQCQLHNQTMTITTLREE